MGQNVSGGFGSSISYYVPYEPVLHYPLNLHCFMSPELDLYFAF